MTERNAGVPAERRINFRVGINLGDIIIDGDDIFGDGVNVAARLEALAEPGGICVNRVVRDQVRDKLAFAFEDLGEQRVKNIARPVSGADRAQPRLPNQCYCKSSPQCRNFFCNFVEPLLLASVRLLII
jgi:class 3 adenylate cyclase